MSQLSSQRGVGLMEVLVALLVLMIGVLGFIVLQYRAVEATMEGGNRVQAINIARDFAERIRVNRGALATYETNMADSTKQKTMGTDCSKAYCTVEKLAAYDVWQVAQRANSFGMVVNLLDCQGTADGRKCIYVAWGDTAPTDGDTNEGNCTVSTAYDPTSTCLIMEVY